MFFFIKRVADIIVAIIGLIIFSPLFLAVYLVLKLEGGSVVYKQTRIGKARKLFQLLKFRSMVQNADELLFNDRDLLKELRSGAHKIIEDPRVTRVGRVLRKFSIDEFPQFINVLLSDMSFVGPRAYRPDELEKYEKEHPESCGYIESILSVKPGITGLWQVSGRSNVSFDQRVKMEAEYARRKSLLLDLYIILKTPIVVIRGEGAA